jgi:CrcB protein
MTRVLLVAAGSALGGTARYVLSGVVQRGLGATFPYGTLAVNVAGCFLIGAFMMAVESRLSAPPEARIFLVVGILGGFTTFSAFGYETEALLRDQETWLALGNVAANVGLGLAAVVLGRAAVVAIGL